MPVSIKRPGGFHIGLLATLSFHVEKSRQTSWRKRPWRIREDMERPHGKKLKDHADNPHQGSRHVNKALHPQPLTEP